MSTTVCLTFDFDAISLWIGPMSATSPSMISRGEFGVVGVARILRLLTQHDIRATFFVTGHTADTYPDSVRAIVAAGHEIGHHGYLHENVASLTEEQERKILIKSIEVYKQFTGGKHPKGYIAPNWAPSCRTIRLLEEFGLEYDHSLFAHDALPHWAFDVGEDATYADYSKDPSTWMEPLRSQGPPLRAAQREARD